MSDVSGVGGSSDLADLMLRAKAPEPTNTLGKDAFLKLLVAQLKYQNPLSPSDPGEFMAQTAQFTMVQKLEELARQGADGALGQKLATASALVGREITWTDAQGNAASGVVSSARLAEDGTLLRVGDVEVPIGAVHTIAP